MFILVHNTLLRAYRVVTEEYTPPGGVMDRVKQYTSLYGRAGAGGTDYIDQPFVIQAGIQIVIPLTSTKERREQAMKAVEETRAMDEIRGKALADIAKLRQHEADLSAAETRLKFYEDKSGWLQKRVFLVRGPEQGEQGAVGDMAAQVAGGAEAEPDRVSGRRGEPFGQLRQDEAEVRCRGDGGGLGRRTVRRGEAE